jgi:histidyl-tRNA synthetase
VLYCNIKNGRIMKKKNLNTVKGMRDFSYNDMIIREKMIDIIKRNFKSFGFLPIETPTLERYELLMEKYGDDADKLIYNFEDRAGRRLGMIYDLTVPLSRFVAQNYAKIKFPFKRYQIQRVYRYENPQKGRFREFYQCDIDTIGSNSPFGEAELLIVASKILIELGIKNFGIDINFRTFLDEYLTKTGIKNDREKELFLRAVDKLDKRGIDNVIGYLRENNFSMDPQKLIDDLKNYDSIPEKFDEIKKYYTQFFGEDNLKFNPLMARGLSYYTDTIFEIVLTGEDMGSIAGGGRYDNLVEDLLGVKLPSCGISLGFERIFEILKNKIENNSSYYDYMIINSNNPKEEMTVFKNLIEKGYTVFYYPDNVKYQNQFKFADAYNIKFAVIIGADEVKNNTITIKNLKTREQKTEKREV